MAGFVLGAGLVAATFAAAAGMRTAGPCGLVVAVVDRFAAAAAALTEGSAVSGLAALIRAGLQYCASACFCASAPVPLTVRATSGLRRAGLLTAAAFWGARAFAGLAVAAAGVVRAVAIAAVTARPP